MTEYEVNKLVDERLEKLLNNLIGMMARDEAPSIKGLMHNLRHCRDNIANGTFSWEVSVEHNLAQERKRFRERPSIRRWAAGSPEPHDHNAKTR